MVVHVIDLAEKDAADLEIAAIERDLDCKILTGWRNGDRSFTSAYRDKLSNDAMRRLSRRYQVHGWDVAVLNGGTLDTGMPAAGHITVSAESAAHPPSNLTEDWDGDLVDTPETPEEVAARRDRDRRQKLLLLALLPLLLVVGGLSGIYFVTGLSSF